MNLRRKELARRTYVPSMATLLAIANPSSASSDILPPRPQRSNAPSGIAQLRQSSHSRPEPPPESMNLDDFLVPNVAASPVDVKASITEPTSSSVSAIPIRKQKELQAQDTFLARASAPSVPPIAHVQNQEFGYVQRRLRKTSIDERRVRHIITSSIDHLLTCSSHRRDVQKPRLRYSQLTTIPVKIHWLISAYNTLSVSTSPNLTFLPSTIPNSTLLPWMTLTSLLPDLSSNNSLFRPSIPQSPVPASRT